MSADKIPCPMCGEQIAATAKKCRFCNEWLDKSAAPPPAAPQVDPALGLVLPVNVSPLAIIAGYLGLFSMLMLPAPIGLAVSIFAIRDLKLHPDRSGWGRAIFGLLFSGLFSVIFLLIVISSMTKH